MRILLVEDEEKVSRFVSRGLTAEPFAVDMARDGKSGWELAQTYQYDLIILDLMLPGLTGGEVLNREFPGLAFCLGGRSLFWGGWSPYFIDSEIVSPPWPATVRRDVSVSFCRHVRFSMYPLAWFISEVSRK